MSFVERMQANVGDADPVYRYLIEKAAHSCLIEWTIAMLGMGLTLPGDHRPVFLVMVCIALVSGGLYDLIGKALWFSAHGWPRRAEWGFEIRDTLFDGWVGCYGAFAATAILHWYYLPIAVALWLAGITIGSNSQWGSPS